MNDNKKPTAILTFMRHGEKADDGNLTYNGRYQAKDAGLKTNHLNDQIILFHSGVDRVKDTVRTMSAHLHLSESQEHLLELGENIADYVVPNLHYLKNATNKGDLFGHWDDIEFTYANILNRIDNFLNLEDKSSEPDVYYSPVRMAKNIATVIDTEVRFANITDAKHRVNFINGSHEPVLMSFIYYFLSDYQPDSTAMIDDLGGPIDFAESFDIYIYQNSQNDYELEFKFRHIQKPLDINQLRKFIDL